MATSLAAQLGVAPVLDHHFGPPPLVAVPANLVAGWAAGAIMTWGLTVGVVAGMLPPGVAAVVQWPADRLLWWLDTVAAVGAGLPGPRAGPWALLAVAAVLVVLRASAQRGARLAAAATLVGMVVAATPRAPSGPGHCGDGITWYPAGDVGSSVLVLDGEAGPRAVEACRLAGIRRADVVVARSGSRWSGSTVAALGEVIAVGRVLAPPQHAVVGATRVLEPVVIPVDGGWLTIDPDRDDRRLVVAPVVRPPP